MVLVLWHWAISDGSKNLHTCPFSSLATYPTTCPGSKYPLEISGFSSVRHITVPRICLYSSSPVRPDLFVVCFCVYKNVFQLFPDCIGNPSACLLALLFEHPDSLPVRFPGAHAIWNVVPAVFGTVRHGDLFRYGFRLPVPIFRSDERIPSAVSPLPFFIKVLLLPVYGIS